MPGASASVAPVATANSFSCDLGDSKHKCVRTIMRAIRLSSVKGESFGQEKANVGVCVKVCHRNNHVNAECVCDGKKRLCGLEEQFRGTTDCIMSFEMIWSLSCDSSACQLHICCGCVVCVHDVSLPVTLSEELVPMEA